MPSHHSGTAPSDRSGTRRLNSARERDSTPSHHDEARASSSSDAITLFVLPRSAHCHNSAGTRHVLWDRLVRWIGAEVRIGTRFEPPSPEPDDPVLATPMTWNVRPMA
jgi:hypothetical protein